MKNGGYRSLTAIVNLTMSQRVLNTKWLCCLVMFSVVPAWSPVNSVSVPPNTPATVEAQAKFFQDFFSVQLSPYKIEFGHVCEDPNTWEQRYEKKDYKNHRDMGKVRWGDKHGGYGEHYWDLNHAGHTDNHGHDDYGNDDDGSYSIHENEDPYDEPSEQSPVYNDEYDAENSAKSNYDESNRAKRHHQRVKEAKDSLEVKPLKKESEDEQNDRTETTEERQPRYKKKLKRHHIKPKEIDYEEDLVDVKTDDVAKLVPRNNQQQNKYYQQQQQQQQNLQKQQDFQPQHNFKPQQNFQQQQNSQQQSLQQQSLQQQNLQQQNLQQQQNSQQQNLQQQQNSQQQGFQQQPQQNVYQQKQQHFVPYESGAGVRHHQPELATAASSPRLFLEPSTGHVVDRATGQAYILQPIAGNFN